MLFQSKLAGLSAVVLSVMLAACQTSSIPSVPTQSNSLSALDSTKMMKHLSALQNIAQDNGGNRAVGSKGGLATAQYIVAQAKQAGLHAQMLPFETRDQMVGQNIMVEIAGQSKDSAIIVGAHYDSVPAGPGINDNGSGVAVLLELMHHYAAQQAKPKHTLYLAFWDAEEQGIAGSQDFVRKLSPEQLKGIQAYINLDMVGTKNPTIQIADGDQSSLTEMEAMLKANGMQQADYQPVIESLRSIPRHTRDLTLEQHLKAFFKSKGIQVKEDVSTLTASDTAPFLGKVPVTSLILFNEQMKGDVLEFAPCYHQACDTLDQVDPKSLSLASEAVLYLLNRLNQQ